MLKKLKGQEVRKVCRREGTVCASVWVACVHVTGVELEAMLKTSEDFPKDLSMRQPRE